MKRLKYILITILLLSIPCFTSQAQKVAIGTNALEWGNFGTVNLEAGVAISQHFSISAGARYNPWEFKTDSPHLVVQNKQQTFFTGVRYWPWYVFSGWWIEGKIQYSVFTRSGVWRPAVEVGKGVGAGISAGYTLLLTRHLNIEFGAGIWGGKFLERILFDCPLCLNVRESGVKNFARIDNASVSLFYIF